jgi:hypothetical protein
VTVPPAQSDADRIRGEKLQMFIADYYDNTWLPLCSSIADAVVSRLHRPLTEKERRAVWRTRLPLTLEVVLKEIQGTSSSEAIAALLERLPPGIDRPDSARWCEAKQPYTAAVL